MKKLRMVEVALVGALMITMGVFLCTSASSAADIHESVVRLHIRARSNDERDQAVKLLVRDAVIESTRGAMEKLADAADARAFIAGSIDDIERTANKALAAVGANYGATASFEQTWFPTREYGSVTLPAGRYDALVIELGGGAGQNWWCVMFPTLCYQGDVLEADGTAMDYLHDNLDENDYAAITNGEQPEYVVKFKILEFFGWLFG